MSQVPSRAVLDQIKTLLGSGGWLDADTDVAPYLTDFRRLYRGRTPLVARPRHTAQVAELVSLCAREQIAIVPHGGNTSYCGGATPDETNRQIVVSLDRMNHVRSVDATGYTLTVDAGITLARAREVATAAGRYFPLSLGSEGSCQIGGNLSTNAGGTAVLRYGMMRDLVLGLEVVLPDGSVLDQLKGLRKDNTGYDLKQLFIGAEGTLGIITGACLKLFAPPADYVTALVAVDDIASAVALLGRTRDYFGEIIESFEYMPAVAHELALTHVPGTVDPFDRRYPALVLLELAAPRPWAELGDRVADYLSTEATAGRIHDAVVARSLTERDAFWFLREHIPEAQTRAGASIKHDVSLPITALQEFVDRATSLLMAEAPGARIVGYGHVGDGNLHFNLSPAASVRRGSVEEADFLKLAPVVGHALHELVAALGGSFSAEHGIGRLKIQELERYEDPVALLLMRRLKQMMDPRHLMNPGKILRMSDEPR